MPRRYFDRSLFRVGLAAAGFLFVAAQAYGAAGFPFTEDFESGVLASYWTTNSTGAGRIQVSTANSPNGGSYHLLMDTASGFALNELILTINLTGQSCVTLSFYQKEFADESSPMPASFTGSSNSEGVAVSADGVTWYRAVDLGPPANFAYQQFTVDLDAVVAAAGISYNSQFKIKFQQYDNFAIATDGFAFDDIVVDVNPFPCATVAATDAAAGEPANNGIFTVTLSQAPSTNVSVNFTVSGTATEGADYVAISTAVTVSAGATTATIPITVIDDLLGEGDETVTITLTGGLNYFVGVPNSATVNIADNEPVATIVATDATLSEPADNGLLTVTLSSAPPTNLVVDFTVSGTATEGEDYATIGTSVTVIAGTTSATIPLIVINDTVGEGDESIAVTLTPGTGYGVDVPDSVTVTLADDEPAVTISAADPSAAEPADHGLFTVTLSKVLLSDLIVEFSVSGSATEGFDYYAIGTSVTIIAGATSVDIPVTVIDDFLMESAETVEVTLSGDLGYFVSSPGDATVSLGDDEGYLEDFDGGGPPAGWSVTGGSWAWGTPTGGPGADHTTGAGQCYGTVLGGSYWNNTNASLTSPAVAIPTTASSPVLVFWMWKDAETWFDGGHLEIAVDGGSFTVVPAASLSVAYNGTASALTDNNNCWTGTTYATWTEVTMDLSAYVGQTVQFRFHFASDNIITRPGWYIDDYALVGVGTASTLTATIEATDGSAAEPSDGGLFTVTLSAPWTADLAIYFGVSGTAAEGLDYAPIGTMVIVPAGSTTATIPLDVIDDALIESDQTVTVTLQTGGTDSATVTIVDDDSSGAPAVVINEIETGGNSDWVEIYNADLADVELSGWRLTLETAGEISFPTGFVLPVDDYILIRENAGTDTATELFAGFSFPWTTSGSCALFDGAGIGLDFVRFGSSTAWPPAGTTWIGVNPAAPALGGSLGRDRWGTDTDAGDDWKETGGVDADVPTPGSANLTVPLVTILAMGATVGEPANHGWFTVTLSGARRSNVVVNFTVGGTATEGVDYKPLGTSVTVPAWNVSASIPLTVIDDTLLENNETVILTLLDGGTEYSVGTPGIASMAIEDNDDGRDAYEPDNSFTDAQPIALNETQTHSIHVVGDQDYGTFTLSSATDIIIETDGLLGDTILYLYDGTYTLMTSNDDGGNGFFSRISVTALPPGTYYTKVEEFANDATIDSYTLTLSLQLVPSGVVATAGDGSISINWDPVPGAISYNVYYDEDSSNPPYTPNNLANQGGSPISTAGISSTLTGLANGSAVYLAVTAVSAFGESGYSEEVSATPTAGVGGLSGDGGSESEGLGYTGGGCSPARGDTWTPAQPLGGLVPYFALLLFCAWRVMRSDPRRRLGQRALPWVLAAVLAAGLDTRPAFAQEDNEAIPNTEALADGPERWYWEGRRALRAADKQTARQRFAKVMRWKDAQSKRHALQTAAYYWYGRSYHDPQRQDLSPQEAKHFKVRTNWELADRLFATVYQLDPGVADDVLLRRGEILVQIGRVPEGLKLLKSFAEQATDAALKARAEKLVVKFTGDKDPQQAVSAGQAVERATRRPQEPIIGLAIPAAQPERLSKATYQDRHEGAAPKDPFVHARAGWLLPVGAKEDFDLTWLIGAAYIGRAFESDGLLYEIGVDLAQPESGSVKTTLFMLRADALYRPVEMRLWGNKPYVLGGYQIIQDRSTQRASGRSSDTAVTHALDMGVGLSGAARPWDVRLSYALFLGTENVKGQFLLTAGLDF